MSKSALDAFQQSFLISYLHHHYKYLHIRYFFPNAEQEVHFKNACNRQTIAGVTNKI